MQWYNRVSMLAECVPTGKEESQDATSRRLTSMASYTSDTRWGSLINWARIRHFKLGDSTIHFPLPHVLFLFCHYMQLYSSSATGDFYFNYNLH
jgi:hypothetical protein